MNFKRAMQRRLMMAGRINPELIKTRGAPPNRHPTKGGKADDDGYYNQHSARRSRRSNRCA